MKLAWVLFVTACGSAKPATEMTTTASPSTTPTTSQVAPSASPPPTPAATPARPTTAPASTMHAPAGKKPQYSCFSYVSRNSTVTRHACMRTEECGPYLEQAKSVGGIRELSGCANAASVYCFHQVATKDEPEGLDICQPTLDACKTARADVVRAKMSVDSDCAQR